jgi:hypothetical protein
MTLLLRRKRRTTRASLRRTSSGCSDARCSMLDARCWMVALALVVCVSSAHAASELKWRSERAEASSQWSQSQTTPTSTTTSIPPRPSTYAPSGNALRFTRPQATSLRNDRAIRLTAFEEDAPKLTSARESDIKTRSVVVNREDASDSVRSAQLPSTGAGAAGAGSTNSQPLDRLRSPFGDTNEPPPLETPTFNTPSSQENNQVPPPKDNLLREPQRNPAQNAPAEQSTTAPPVGQFQPVLPSGPTPPLPIETGPPAPLTPTATVEAEKGKAKESCDKSLENLRAYTVDKVNLNISIKGTEGKDYPFECTIDDGQQFKGRCWEQTTYMWKASAMCHKPLYFEDEQLERYGHSFSPCFQPFISGAHFFCTLPVLPYCMGVEPPCECIYALGYYRPGSCAPYMCNPVPLSWRGALFEAGVVTGAAYALP